MSDLKNILIALALAFAVMMGWQFFYEAPRLKVRQDARANQKNNLTTSIKHDKGEGLALMHNRMEAIKSASSNRVKIESDVLSGSIALTGARLDDLILLQYKQTADPHSPPTVLLSPAQYKHGYFIEFGWTSDVGTAVPDSRTQWRANKEILKANDKVTLSWSNPAGVLFYIDISLDSNYMFTITQRIQNNSRHNVAIRSYSLINRLFDLSEKQVKISHEGPIGVFNKVLKEVTYKDLEDKKVERFEKDMQGSWFGISDKYWLTALAPRIGQNQYFDTKFQYAGKGKFQVDCISDVETIPPGQQSKEDTLLFTGAKVLSILDGYEKQFNLSLFDRAIDFGWLYFITKPMLSALKYFYNLVGNFGISILIVTIIVKLCLFPLANKSYASMNKMKALQPEITRLRELYANDKLKQNQELLALYKRKKVSPLSGCLPLLIQIPIFFSLYKVLFVTIEMHHAPFYGWITDLSAPDPTSVFNLFGLIPWSPPKFLMIGAWPIIMAITMFVQQSFSPEPADPIQAKMMKFLPLIFLFMFASFPVGLIIYWAWSNILSIAQQYVIKYIHEHKSTN
jgi:YidC/Oxa1 family membrane protein insertase